MSKRLPISLWEILFENNSEPTQPNRSAEDARPFPSKTLEDDWKYLWTDTGGEG